MRSPSDMPMGTVVFNADHGVFALKTKRDCWVIYYNGQNLKTDEEMAVALPGDQEVGTVRLERDD